MPWCAKQIMHQIFLLYIVRDRRIQGQIVPHIFSKSHRKNKVIELLGFIKIRVSILCEQMMSHTLVSLLVIVRTSICTLKLWRPSSSPADEQRYSWKLRMLVDKVNCPHFDQIKRLWHPSLIEACSLCKRWNEDSHSAIIWFDR
jgi:hypothetical protein